MITHTRRLSRTLTSLTILALVSTAPHPLRADVPVAPPLVDDFSTTQRHGAERLVVTDRDLGSQSHATQLCSGGVLSVRGELIPGRGVPAFVSVPLMLAAGVQPQDVSGYEGVRLRVKVAQGALLIQVASAEVDNFDYHTSGPVAAQRGEFQEVQIPFKELKRGWSAPTPLNLKTIISVNLVAFGTARQAFAYEVDEIGFY